MLTALGSYGGPTQTMIPLLSSPAVGAGQYVAGEPVTDQRGLPRPATAGSVITLGAVQVQYVIVTTGNHHAQNADCTSGTGDGCSIRDAINVANTQGIADITFASYVHNVDATRLDITGHANMIGPGARALTVTGKTGDDQTYTGQAFAVASGGEANFSGMTFSGAPCYLQQNMDGGMLWIHSGGVATVRDSIFENNCGDFGGAICNAGTLTVGSSVFRHNSAMANGGAIFNVGKLTVTNSGFFLNGLIIMDFFGLPADYDGHTEGGAIFNQVIGTAEVSNCTFDFNGVTLICLSISVALAWAALFPTGEC